MRPDHTLRWSAMDTGTIMPHGNAAQQAHSRGTYTSAIARGKSIDKAFSNSKKRLGSSNSPSSGLRKPYTMSCAGRLSFSALVPTSFTRDACSPPSSCCPSSQCIAAFPTNHLSTHPNTHACE
eukprot:788907-Rhodomonas_salina.2